MIRGEEEKVGWKVDREGKDGCWCWVAVVNRVVICKSRVF
jgi:hypothetical protein